MTNSAKNNFILKIKTQEIKNYNLLKDSVAVSPGVDSEISLIALKSVIDNSEDLIIFYEKDNEQKILNDFWNFVNSTDCNLITWGGKLFEFPLLYQRTFAKNLEVKNMRFPLPIDVGTYKASSYQNELIDLMQYWKCGSIRNDKLINVAISCGIVSDPKDVEFFIEQETNYKNFLSDFLSDTKNSNSSKFLKMQMHIIKELAVRMYI